jgi:hypothetical protein
MWKSFCRTVHAKHARLASYILGVGKKEHQIHFDRCGVGTVNAAMVRKWDHFGEMKSFWYVMWSAGLEREQTIYTARLEAGIQGGLNKPGRLDVGLDEMF